MNRTHRARLRVGDFIEPDTGNHVAPDADGLCRRGLVVLRDEPAKPQRSSPRERPPVTLGEAASASQAGVPMPECGDAGDQGAAGGEESGEDPDPPAATGYGPPPFYGMPPILTVGEAARFLRLNVKTVYAAILAGELPGKKVRCRTVVLRDALIDCLSSKKRELPSRRR